MFIKPIDDENEDYARSMGYKEPLIKDETETHLDLTNTSLKIYYPNIDKLPNNEYALIRKNGLGTSDSSIVLGVNPYETLYELIGSKARNYLTPEEIAVGEEVAVKKGRDLEPLIIKKFEESFMQKNWKPSDMYVHKEFPYIKFNYDGVTGTPEQYIPCEIKVVTARGEKHYQKAKAMYIEGIGFRPIQPNVSDSNNSISTKASTYGIPPYYYTQLQQEIMGLNAPFGYLATLMEKDWKLHVFFVYRDETVINDLIIRGAKVWEQVEELRRSNGFYNVQQDSGRPSEQMPSDTDK